MNRRTFLKLVCAAVVAPSLPLLKPAPVPVLTRDSLLRLIKERRDAARQACIADLEQYLVVEGYSDRYIGMALEDIPAKGWGWVSLSIPINYKQ